MTNNPNNVRVPKDGWITIAFVPRGTDVPAPPNWKAKVDKANGTAARHTSTTTPGAPTNLPNPSTVPPTAPPTTAATGTPTTKP